MPDKIVKKCEVCYYMAAIGFVMILQGLLYPFYEKEIAYFIAGSVRSLASLIGFFYMAKQTWTLRGSKTRLANRLQSASFMTAVMFLINLAFGIGGFTQPSPAYWEFVYTLCAMVITLEAIALSRLWKLWSRETGN